MEALGVAKALTSLATTTARLAHGEEICTYHDHLTVAFSGGRSDIRRR